MQRLKVKTCFRSSKKLPKKVRQLIYFFPPLFFVLDLGSGMEKNKKQSGIWNKHPRSSTLVSWSQLTRTRLPIWPSQKPSDLSGLEPGGLP